MRKSMVALVAGAMLSFMSMPVQAAWHGYVNRDVGFSFYMPGDVKADKATYKAPSGEHAATVFQSAEDNVLYKVTVVEFGNATEADAVKDATANLQGGGKKILADEDARVDQSYGRKMTLELPNSGGRSMAGIYFKKGHLIQLEVTVLPANGDYQTPDMGRFVDSVAFLESRVEADATELKLQK